MCEINKSNEGKPGLVYILLDPLHHGVVKIGMSTRPAKVRAAELDNTSVALPFEVFAAVYTKDYELLEKTVHNHLDLMNKRVRPNREFFYLSPEVALEVLLVQARLVPDAVVIKYDEDENPIQIYPIIPEDTQPKKKKKKAKRDTDGRFSFESIGIKTGEFITFIPTGEKLEVYDDDQDPAGKKNSIKTPSGQYFSLSGYALAFMPDNKRKPSDKEGNEEGKRASYQGPRYFSYKGVKLSIIQDRVIDKGMTLEEVLKQESNKTKNNGERN